MELWYRSPRGLINTPKNKETFSKCSLANFVNNIPWKLKCSKTGNLVHRQQHIADSLWFPATFWKASLKSVLRDIKMLILLAPVIPLLGIYLNQITQNIFFKHRHKKSPLKYYLQCLPMTTSYSPTHHESQVVWLGFLRDSPRDICRFPNLTMHLYMKLWPFMCKEELLPSWDACPLAMWYCFSTLQEVKSVYPSFDLSLAM